MGESTDRDQAPAREGYLRTLSVLELGDGVAGAAATAILAGFGASVTSVVRPDAPHRRGRPYATGRDGRSGSLLSLLLDRGKDLVDVTGWSSTELEDLVRGERAGAAPRFDLVIADRVGGPVLESDQLDTAEKYSSWVQEINPNAWLTISAYGLSGPRRDDVATDLALGAVSGVMGSVRDPRTGRPLKLAGAQALLSTGQVGALAACHALDLARDGRHSHLDLSAQEATIATGPMLALATHLLGCTGPAGAKRSGAPANFYPCTDGIIWITAMEQHHWEAVVRAMGSPAWTESLNGKAERIAQMADIDIRVAAWTSGFSKADAEAHLQAHGVPANAMYAPSEIIESPQLAYRGSLASSTVLDGVEVRSVGRPFIQLAPPEGPPATSRGRSLRGLRVLEAGHVLAVPLAASILGALGADVTKLEDVHRIDMYRRLGPYIDGVEGVNRAAYFSMVNHSKQSVSIDFGEGIAQLEQLLEQADVVIENFGARRAGRFGLSASVINATHPDVLGLSSSGFGHDGPHASYRAYAYNLQTSCGPGYLTRNEAGDPAEIDSLAWADLNASYCLATIVAAWAVGPAGNTGGGIDFAMADLIIARFNEFIAAASLDPHSDDHVDRANEAAPYAPNGVYQTADGWVALSVDDDESFRRLSEMLGSPEALQDPRFSTGASRFENRRELDPVLDQIIASRGSRELVKELRSVGVVAEPVLAPGDLIEDPHLVERGFFGLVSHSEWGQRRLIGIPWRAVGEPALGLGTPPLLRPA